MGRTKPGTAPPRTGLPEELALRLRTDHGVDTTALDLALAASSPVSFRTNPLKPSPACGTPVPWCGVGHVLPDRPAFTFDPFLHAGAYYVQEASSMLLEEAFRVCGLTDRTVLALDLCAAPGGKSTHLRSLLTPASLLVANEVDGQRRSVLQENLWKWGHGNVVVTAGNNSHFHRLPGTFDVVVLDAPCSGEGMFRKDPHALTQWSPGLVQQCARVQRDLVDVAWRSLRPGGVLFYSTCTWEECENEDHVRHLLEQGAESILPTAAPLGVVTSGAPGLGWRCYPHLIQGEGFYLSALRKPGPWTPHDASIPARRSSSPWSEHLVDPNGSHLTEHKTILHAVDVRWQRSLDALMAAVPVVSPGIPIAQPKGPVLHPHPALALSLLLRQDAFPELDLDEPSAIRYLKGEALPALDARGTTRVVHRGLGLGWMQGAGRRWNNQWPSAWRIRAAHPSVTRVSWSSIPTGQDNSE